MTEFEEPELPDWAWEAYEESLEFQQEEMEKELKILELIEKGEYYTKEEREQIEREQKELQDELNKETKDEFARKKQRSFDELVDRYKPLVSLHGRSYSVPTKFIFYSVLSNFLKENYFQYGNQKLDMRIPLLVMMDAGSGKKNYASFVKRTVEGLGQNYCEPTSYHAEQFVGTVNVYPNRKEEDERYEQVEGYLADDFVVVDEAHKLLAEAGKNDEVLKYIRLALDNIGNNEIRKKLVRVPPEYQLQYIPTCNIVLLSQPLSGADADLLITGSLRRFVVVYARIPEAEKRAALKCDRFLVVRDDGLKEIWEKWLAFCKEIGRYEFVGKTEDFEGIDQYIERKWDAVKSQDSLEAKTYLESNLFTMKYMIFRMALIRAVVENVREKVITVERRHIEAAIRDYDVVLKWQIDWISQQMVVDDVMPIGWTEEHGEIFKVVENEPGISQKEIIDRLDNGLVKRESLRVTVGKKLKKLQAWNMVKMEKEGRYRKYYVVEN